MIADIIKEVYAGQPEAMMRELYNQSIICGYLFRSFDDFTQHLIFQMYANEGAISKSQIIARMGQSGDGQNQFTTAIANLTKILVVSRSQIQMDSVKYILNDSFAKQLNVFIMNTSKDFGEPVQGGYEQFFNLLQLLRDSNDILRYCKIGGMGDGKMTKQNFEFIRQPIGYKISILLKGYLKLKRPGKERQSMLKNILVLSSWQVGNKYKLIDSNKELVGDLQSIRLVRRIENGYFVISPYLHNFAFEQKRNTRLLQCSIIVQTNFKVYVQIAKSNNNLNYKIIRDIMKKLIKIDNEGYQFEELIVGEIDRTCMKQLFDQKISIQEYLSFFFQYMDDNLCIENDLGKWNKITFLGLQGPKDEMKIPNNVRQELKLWESISRKDGIYGKYIEDITAYTQEEYDYYD